MTDCPDDTELAGFLNDALAPGRLAGVAGHVDRCALCQTRLDRLTEQSAGAAARYRELSSGELPNAVSGAASSPEAATQVLGAKPIIPVFGGKPVVPGFEIIAEIGRGGMGVVYKARHQRLNRLVALKMVLAGGAADPHTVQRFLFEGEVLARVQHPQVVTVFEVDTYEGPNRAPVPYLAMELLEGGSLSRRLRDANDGAAPRFAPREAAALVEGLARAVHAAHLQGVVHRDLKPGNILFGSAEFGTRNSESKSESSTPGLHSSLRAPNSALPKVTDFGLAKFTQEAGSDLTQTGQIVGTPQYMAPEQASGARTIGPATDVYALGVILFECLAGRPPFAGGDPMSLMLKVINDPPPDVRALCPGVHRDLAAVAMKCLAKEPARRYASAEALADDLARYLGGRPTKARPVTGLERLWFSARRNPTVAALVGALALALSTAFVAFAVLWVRAEKQTRTEEQLRLLAEGRARTEGELREAAQEANARALVEVKRRQRRESQLGFAQAMEWCEDGRLTDGLALFVGALQLAEATGDAPLARAARINLAAWARELPKPAVRFKHAEQPRLVAFHPDGKHMVSAGRGRELYLWDTGAPGKPVRAYKPVPVARAVFGAVVGVPTYWTVDISPDGRLIAAGSSDGSVTLWDTSDETPRGNFPLPDPKVAGFPASEINAWTLAFTGARELWTCDGANGLRKWDVTDPKKPTSAAFVPRSGKADRTLQIMVPSADRKRLYTGDRAGRVREWDVATGAERRSWHVKGWVTDVAVSPDGTHLAATGTGAVVSVFDLTAPVRPDGDTRDEKPLAEIGLAGTYGNGVAFAPKRPYLVASDGDGNVRFWHRDTGHPVGPARQFNGEVTRMRFRPDTDRFAVPAGDSVYLCALPDPPGDLLALGRKSRLRGLDFDPKGDRLVVADDRGVGLFDLRRPGEAVALSFDSDALTVRFDPNPERPWVLRGTRKGFDRFAAPGGKYSPGVPFVEKFQRLDFPRDGSAVFALTTIAVARYELPALTPGPIRRPAEKLPAGVELGALAVRPDGGEVFVSYGDRAAVLKGDTLDPLRAWDIGDEVLDARYTPDGKLILIGRRSGAAELLDAQTGVRVGPQMPHRGAIAGVSVGPNGLLLLTGSRDGTARFWDAPTGLPLGPPRPHAGAVTHVAFAPDGDHAATGTDTGHVMLWDVPPPPIGGSVDELRVRFGPKE